MVPGVDGNKGGHRFAAVLSWHLSRRAGRCTARHARCCGSAMLTGTHRGEGVALGFSAGSERTESHPLNAPEAQGGAERRKDGKRNTQHATHR